jgi:hypothetical protein
MEEDASSPFVQSLDAPASHEDGPERLGVLDELHGATRGRERDDAVRTDAERTATRLGLLRKGGGEGEEGTAFSVV